MTGTDKVVGLAAALMLVFTLTSAPAQAQFAGLGGGGLGGGGFGGGGDMMTQMAPMLDMMKHKMGKRKFGKMMKTMGPIASQMMQNGGFGGVPGGGGFGGAPGGGGFGGAPGGFGGGYGGGFGGGRY
jgi:hypothetical protein